MSPLGLTISQIHNMKLCGYEKKMRLVYMEWYGKMSIVRGEKWLASKVGDHLCPSGSDASGPWTKWVGKSLFYFLLFY